MRIRVHAEDLLRDQASPVANLDGPCTVGQAVRLLPLTRSTGLMILVNGKLAHWETVLQDGDVVELIPVDICAGALSGLRSPRAGRNMTRVIFWN